MAFAVSICAFAAAGINAVAHYSATGWLAIGGMAGVGLFYLLVGLFDLKRTSSRPRQTINEADKSNLDLTHVDRETKRPRISPRAVRVRMFNRD